MLLISVLLAATVDGGAALRHAAALSALGPHPLGSPRGRAAAEYVAAQLRAAGLSEVRLQEFEARGQRGVNAIGVLRGPGADALLIAAHHDTAPGSPGAWHAASGAGLLIELARALAHDATRTRTLVFAAWDGAESREAAGAGARHWVASLDAAARDVVAGLVLERCGRAGSAPLLHALPHPDPLRPGRSLVAPAWLVSAARQGAGLPLGEPAAPWLYQPAARTFRLRAASGDRTLLQAGVAALVLSDQPARSLGAAEDVGLDTPDRLDVAALTRCGEAAHDIARSLARTPRGPGSDPDWFLGGGRTLGRGALLALGGLALLPGLVLARRSGGPLLLARGVQAVALAVLLWRHPVPTLWAFLLPLLMLPRARAPWLAALAQLPLLALLAVGVVARARIEGAWLAPWELGLALLAWLLLWARMRPAGPSRGGGRAGRRR